MIIDNREIGSAHPPYVIAEMSANHLQDIERAYQLIEIAKSAGVDAVKIQTFSPDSMTIDCDKKDFVISHPLWGGKTFYELYDDICLPMEWNKLLFDKAREIGITIFSTPFDETCVDLLEGLNAPAYKIASFEANDLQFVQKVASTKKPLIISTGVSSFEGIENAVAIARDAGCKEIAVLHCISDYPAKIEQTNLRALSELAKLNVEIGLSDHSLSNLAAVVSVGLGASIIEKHFTLRRKDGGADAVFSLEPDELSALKKDTLNAWEALGHADILKNSRDGEQFGRSLYFVTDIHAGETITEQHIRSIRPGFGLPPKFYSAVIGKTMKKNVERGTAVSWDLIDE